MSKFTFMRESEEAGPVVASPCPQPKEATAERLLLVPANTNARPSLGVAQMRGLQEVYGKQG